MGERRVMYFDEDRDYEFNARYDDVRERYAATVADCEQMAADDAWWDAEEVRRAVAALGFTAEPIALIFDAPADPDPDDLPF